MKCNEARPGFELVSSCPNPATITITPRAPHNIYLSIFLSLYFYQPPRAIDLEKSCKWYTDSPPICKFLTIVKRRLWNCSKFTSSAQHVMHFLIEWFVIWEISSSTSFFRSESSGECTKQHVLHLRSSRLRFSFILLLESKWSNDAIVLIP